ncbi:MAG: hypothetical protein M1819_004277 [Sarea resinae]|nr:MAG: hypothetical protein M1819_004277 [Sarea resinae]
MASVDSILAGKYPAKAHAKRVAEYIKFKKQTANGLIYLEGQKTRMLEDSDETVPFRQRRYFFYLSGCGLPDCSLAYEISTEKLILFIPGVDPEEVIWSGLPLSPTEALEKFDVDEVRTTSEVNPYLGSSQFSKSTVWTIKDQVSDSVTFLEFDDKDFYLVKEAIEECRVVKDAYEIALTRKANEISTIGHHAVLKAAKTAKNERELEALFLERCIAHGSREQAYPSIVGSGTNAATLHYVKNSEPLAGRWNLLLDAGGEYDCYASDITRTFPINGRFNEKSRHIYEIVLGMQHECIEMLKEGVRWESVHEHAHRLAIAGLLKLGILKGSAEDIFAARTSVAFFPHGLGHYLGMDTHDTGGHPNYADSDGLFKYLRVRGSLPAGAIITVEPGIYFCRFMIEPYLKDAKHAGFIDRDVLDTYWDVGGVRIEDNILITATGYENLTPTAKTIADIEALMI